MAIARLIALLATAGCTGGSAGERAGTRARFVLPDDVRGEGDDFYSLPFPNDLRRDFDGTIRLADFPTSGEVVDTYRMAADELDGFGLNAALFARFDGPVDPASLPDAAGSLEATAAVYVVDIDAGSPTYGARTPVVATYRAARTQTLGDHHLAVRPYPGFGLAERTTYALVLTRRLLDPAGEPVGTSDTFAAVIAAGASSETAVLAAREVYAALGAWLDEPGGDERADVIAAAVFTTQTISDAAPALRRGVRAAPVPVATAVTFREGRPQFRLFSGAYEAPNFQGGMVPYDTPGSGGITILDGVAVPTRMEPMRFAVSVPVSAMPAAGYPLVIYQHGTGGDDRSFVDDGTAAALGLAGFAVISTDQVLHGPRNPGGNPELDFFKFPNPRAMRDNSLQGAADAFAQLRLTESLAIVDGATTHRFDTSRVYYFGHSQGGLTGPGFVAFEPRIAGAVFSGTGGILYLALLEKKLPFDIAGLLGAYLEDDPVDANNPSLALLQMWVERADGVNYAPLMVRTPPTVDGAVLAPRNIFQTEGFTDRYTPNASIQAFAVALGGNVAALGEVADVPGLSALRARPALPLPITDNLDGATAVLAQFRERAGSDGHFVVFDIPTARVLSTQFLRTLAETGRATVIAPN